MATNPMQRKARNSFLLGMLLMLIIAGAVIAFLILQLTNMKREEQELQASYVTVYTLNRNVESGEEVTEGDFTITQVTNDTAPTDYLTPSDLGTSMIAKISMTTGTVLSREMIYIDETVIGDDVRKQEYNMFILPSDLITGDYIDVRLQLPSGPDYIVVAKKQVEIPDIAGVASTDTISIELSEDEINMLSNAIVDAYKINGARLYVNKYTEPGLQEASTPTYPVNYEVLELINGNPNMVEEARTALWNRYNATDSSGVQTQASQRTDVIDATINADPEQAQSNLETNMEESIQNSITTRQENLEGLSVQATTTTTTTNTTNTTE